MQPLPPVNMQLRHHHERSTAQTDLALANTGHPMSAAVLRKDCTKNIREKKH